jgi:ABC-type Fe3+/spermidine/putrescine transport system ATPase subunit
VPSSGSIALDGRVVSSSRGIAPLKDRGMALLFQSIALWPHMTVAENVGYGLRQRAMPAPEMASRIDAALEAAGLSKAAGKYPRQLSPESQQRAALARAIAVRPRVLLLDDALATVPAPARQRLAADIRGLARRIHLTLITVTGDIAEALTLSDRIAVLNRGRVEQVDTPGALYMRPETKHVATEMGPALLLAGTRRGNRIDFPGATIDASQVRDGIGPAGPLTLCLRPEHLVILPAASPVPASHGAMAGRVRERTFAGTTWTYTIIPDAGGPDITVVAPNTTVLDAGASVLLAIDPQLVCIVR